MTPKFITPSQLSERWAGEISPRTLANWRAAQKGPPYLKIGGAILYDVAAIEAWEASRTARGTAQYAKWGG